MYLIVRIISAKIQYSDIYTISYSDFFNYSSLASLIILTLFFLKYVQVFHFTTISSELEYG